MQLSFSLNILLSESIEAFLNHLNQNCKSNLCMEFIGNIYFLDIISIMNRVNVKSVGQGLPWWSEWLRICLAVQGTWLRALLQDNPTCYRATNSMCHDSWASAPEPTCWSTEAFMPQACVPTQENSLQQEGAGHCNEKEPLLTAARERASTAMRIQHSQK